MEMKGDCKIACILHKKGDDIAYRLVLDLNTSSGLFTELKEPGKRHGHQTYNSQ